MDESPIILYDNRCGMCHWFVQWVLRNDSGGRFMFAPLDSETGRALLARYPESADVDSVVLIHRGRALIRSEAVIAIGHEIGGFWHYLSVFRAFPAIFRDFAYDALARRRTGLSQKLGLRCQVPTLEQRSRFLS